MNKTYCTSDEKFLKAITVYADSNNVLFQNADKTIAVVAADLIDAFNKNMLLIVDGTETFKPVSMNATAKTFNAVTTTTVESTTTVTVVTYTCEASEEDND